MLSVPGLLSLVLAPLLGALRALRQRLRVDAPPTGEALVPIRISADRPPLRLPPPGRSRRD